MTTNQIQQFGLNSYAQETLLYNFSQNTYSQIVIKAYFHFSHYKSMETLSWHSNENTRAAAIKNINYVEANIINSYAKFQLHHPYGF